MRPSQTLGTAAWPPGPSSQGQRSSPGASHPRNRSKLWPRHVSPTPGPRRWLPWTDAAWSEACWGPPGQEGSPLGQSLHGSENRSFLTQLWDEASLPPHRDLNAPSHWPVTPYREEKTLGSPIPASHPQHPQAGLLSRSGTSCYRAEARIYDSCTTLNLA